MEDRPPTDSPSQKVTRRAQIAVACNRCRSRKTKCDGVRPSCASCDGHGHECHYVAEADATPIIALKRKNEALQLQCSEQQQLLQSLASVSEIDALVLLRRLREGEPAESIILVAANMQRHHGRQTIHESLLPSMNCPSPPNLATQSDTRDSRSPESREPPASSRVILEPWIDVVPSPPSLLPRWR